jgi:hypothetical protein
MELRGQPGRDDGTVLGRSQKRITDNLALELELCTAAPRAGSANQAWITVRSAARKVDVVPDHHLRQFGKANPSLLAENAARLGRIAAQRIDVSSRPLVTTIYFDVLPVESSCRESELDEIAHVTEIDTRAATRRKVVIERQIFVSCRRMSASRRAQAALCAIGGPSRPPSVGPEEQRIVEARLRAIPGPLGPGVRARGR